jgi:hypothetical protein
MHLVSDIAPSSIQEQREKYPKRRKWHVIFLHVNYSKTGRHSVAWVFKKISY